jgi:hypothetical protein
LFCTCGSALDSTAHANVPVSAAEEGGAAVGKGDQECMVVARFGQISECIVLSIHSTSCDGLRLLVDEAFEKHLPTSARGHLRLVFDGRVLPDGDQTLAEAGLGLGKMEVVAELVEKLDCGGGEQERQFKSIPVENLPGLIEAIRMAFEEWRIKEGNPVYKRRFEGDHLEGKEVVWNGNSDSVKYFFEQSGMNPSVDMANFFSSKARTIATSYVWSSTTLFRMSGRLPVKSAVGAVDHCQMLNRIVEILTCFCGVQRSTANQSILDSVYSSTCFAYLNRI